MPAKSQNKETRRSGGQGLTGLLSDLIKLSETGEAVSLGDLVAVLDARGHGPIIVTLAALMMLPVGLLPLMPAIIGALLALTALQMIVGGRGVSLPRRLARVRLSGPALRAGLERAIPIWRRLGRVLHPRLTGLVRHPVSLLLIALALLGASAAMILIGSIPGLPFVLCVPVLLFGLGLTAGDGLFIAIGFAITIPAAMTAAALGASAVAWFVGV